MLTGENGILTQAQRAKEETRAATVEEQVELWHAEKNIQQSLQEQNIKEMEEFLQELKEQGVLYNDEIEEVKRTNKVTIASKTIYFVKDNLADSVDVGDFVNYNEGTGNSYTSLAENNGYGNQTFTTDGTQKWRVLKVENNIVTLISENTIATVDSSKYCLNGKTAYLNGRQELNNICSIYGHGNGAKTARSTTVEDIINACCNMEKYEIKTDYFDISNVKGEEFFDFFDSDGNPATSIFRNYNYYEKLDTVMEKDSIEYKMLFLKNSNERQEFWIATQAFNGNEQGAWYNILYTNYKEGNHNIIYGDHIYKANGDSVERSSFIRPLVELQAGIATYGQDENGVWQLVQNI